uniref:Fibrinogen C-terminal domain-containing protein n=1 Tax=Strongylocentrotus purpuratus TaxID=7668 RepID=A0A7M7N0G2_STRPU
MRSSPEVFPGEPQDCADIKASGLNISRIYGIHPEGVGRSFNVYCDMDTAGGGWTVFQRRKDGSVNFSGNWSHYKKGFGSVSGEHWLGNDKIHRLTSQKTYELRVDMEDFSGTTSHASYGEFMIGNETMNYDLKLGAYSGGGAGDRLGLHRGRQFSTRDRDNDGSEYHCASYYSSGWWFNRCRYCDLNGIYSDDGDLATPADKRGMLWDFKTILTGSEMKLRPLTMDD